MEIFGNNPHSIGENTAQEKIDPEREEKSRVGNLRSSQSDMEGQGGGVRLEAGSE